MKNLKILFICLFLLGLGFAAISTTLLMTGNVSVMSNNENFDVIFTKAVLDGVDISSTAIIDGGKTITFSTKDLVNVGDISKLDFEVTNNSTMYDADISIEYTVNEENKEYYEITNEVASPIAGKSTGTGKVEIRLLKSSTEDIKGTFKCTLTAKAKERISKAREKYVPKYFAVEYGFDLDIPSTASTQDYTTLTYPSPYPSSSSDQTAKIFVGLDNDGQKSVCAVVAGSLECFKNNNAAEEQANIQEAFGKLQCSVKSGCDIECSKDNITCRAYADGDVTCQDDALDFSCIVRDDNSIGCS